MQLAFIPLAKLSVSRTNMRFARTRPDVADILPSVRKRGVLQPVTVRPAAAPDAFEIVAGFRRFTAALIVADERIAAGEEADDLPCAILDTGDDADAVEASMIENMARLDADEVTRWESFTRLVREGRSVDDIAATFMLPEIVVRRTLALGNLLPAIRRMYAAERIDAATVRHLTMATKRQQQAWLALAADPKAYCPTGHQLKAWLFGGESIAVAHALFDVAASGLAIVADLFGDDRYFADADAFWRAQTAAIEARRAAYLAAGWSDAIVVPPAEHFAPWEYEKAAKRKGGRVYLDVRSTGEVAIHEGYVSRREAARLARGETPLTDARPPRPETTAAIQTYVDLHRHAAVRATLLDHPRVALRLMVAHAVAGASLWTVRVQSQVARDPATQESVETAPAEGIFDARRRAVLDALGFDADAPTVTGGARGWRLDDAVVAVFARLLDLADDLVLEVLAIVMGETLASGSPVVEAVGLRIGVDMAQHWQADAAFFDLVRERAVLGAMVAEVAGATIAAANSNEPGKTLKRIITDHLAGRDGRRKVEGWVPRWMAFPPSAYTERGGVGTVAAHARALAAQAAVADADTDRDDIDRDGAMAAASLPPTPDDADDVRLAA
ncbi:ParB/RepB/Spo0J family partition protein [Sphingomonas sp. 1P08PE]|uniref:ParB/RepB/Spo0J family partition protein n=1 Tax=Sphingomonas sp. 1P08PE TaxID=554122 RepID=UPI0039A2A3CE